MVLYFSGTGNSEYVAKRIAKEIQDETINLFDKIKGHDASALKSERAWIVVVPTYAWRIPRIVENWLENAPLQGNKKIYFVMTCAGSIGNAGKYLDKLCDKIHMKYCGCTKVIMPNNYVALSPVPSENERDQIIEQAEKDIQAAVHTIRHQEPFLETAVSFKDKTNSSILYAIYYPLFVHAKKFYASDTCISCGQCVNRCPLNNIQMKNGKPIWGKNCTHCMACISYCPKQAIEYGKQTQGRLRYTCKKDV